MHGAGGGHSVSQGMNEDTESGTCGDRGQESSVRATLHLLILLQPYFKKMYVFSQSITDFSEKNIQN